MKDNRIGILYLVKDVDKTFNVEIQIQRSETEWSPPARIWPFYFRSTQALSQYWIATDENALEWYSAVPVIYPRCKSSGTESQYTKIDYMAPAGRPLFVYTAFYGCIGVHACMKKDEKGRCVFLSYIVDEPGANMTFSPAIWVDRERQDQSEFTLLYRHYSADGSHSEIRRTTGSGSDWSVTVVDVAHMWLGAEVGIALFRGNPVVYWINRMSNDIYGHLSCLNLTLSKDHGKTWSPRVTAYCGALEPPFSAIFSQGEVTKSIVLSVLGEGDLQLIAADGLGLQWKSPINMTTSTSAHDEATFTDSEGRFMLFYRSGPSGEDLYVRTPLEDGSYPMCAAAKQ